MCRNPGLREEARLQSYWPQQAAGVWRGHKDLKGYLNTFKVGMNDRLVNSQYISPETWLGCAPFRRS